MSNRQARREQMRTTRQQRTARQQPSGTRRTGPPGAPRRSGGKSAFMRFISQPFLLIVVAVVLALGAVLGVIIATGDDSDSELVSQLKASEAAFPYDMTDGFKVGKDDAPLKITEFEDFQCPFCLNYSGREEPGIIEEYVKTGKVQIIFANLPFLGAESLGAAKAATCAADQNKFWQLHHRLLLVQAENGQSTQEKTNVGRFSEGELKRLARDAGVDGAAFDSCYSSVETLAKVTESVQLANSFGFRSTPSFLFNDQPYGSGSAGSIEAWRRDIDSALEQIANPSPSATGTATASPSASATGAASATPTAAAPTATRTP